jgi:ABC-type uncharacterized transport system permease subunit
VEKSGKIEPDAIREGAKGQEFDAPEGRVKIEPQNLHTWPRHASAKSSPTGNSRSSTSMSRHRQNRATVNGFNGLTDLGWFHLGSVSFDPYQVQTYYLVAVSLSVVLVLARWLITSKAGLILQSIRDDENRARYLGYDVAHYMLFFFAVSAGMAGFAGMPYVIARR